MNLIIINVNLHYCSNIFFLSNLNQFLHYHYFSKNCFDCFYFNFEFYYQYFMILNCYLFYFTNNYFHYYYYCDIILNFSRIMIFYSNFYFSIIQRNFFIFYFLFIFFLTNAVMEIQNLKLFKIHCLFNLLNHSKHFLTCFFYLLHFLYLLLNIEKIMIPLAYFLKLYLYRLSIVHPIFCRAILNVLPSSSTNSEIVDFLNF